MLYDGYDIAATRRRNCRRFILRVGSGDHRLTLSIPQGARQAEVTSFLDAHRAWLEKQLRDTVLFVPTYAPGERHKLLGGTVALGSPGIPAGEAAFEDFRAQMLDRLVRALLPGWEARLGVRAARVRYRAMVSRWGSCQTVTGAVTLNLRLSRVPPECVEYVLVHELCHLRHPDHSPAFHADMTLFLPDWPARRKRLSAFDIAPLPPA